MPKSLKTNQSVWTKVFRRIVQQVENDPDAKRVIGPTNIRSWKGVPGDKAPFNPAQNQPVVRFTPNPRDVVWYSPDMQTGTLWVLVEMAVASLSIDDVSDLWDVIVHALLPGGPSLTEGTSFELDLVALGAETGEIIFSDPAFDPQPTRAAEGVFLASGHFQLRILRSINP
jgi:hypothetical protein